jgi:hypothetical protein
VRYGGKTTIQAPKDQIGFSPISPLPDGNSKIVSMTHVSVPRQGFVLIFMPQAYFVLAVEGVVRKEVSFTKLRRAVMHTALFSEVVIGEICHTWEVILSGLLVSLTMTETVYMQMIHHQ